MPNIWEQLGLSREATVEEMVNALAGVFEQDCYCDCNECASERLTANTLLTALCAREREAGAREGEARVWGKMCKHCPQSYCQNRKCKALDWDKPDFATCPLLRDEEKGDNQ